MKRGRVVFLMVLAMGAGFYAALPQNDDARRQFSAFAEQATHQVRAQVDLQLAAAGKRLNQELEPTAADLAKWEKLLCDLANEERRKRGLPVMKQHETLAKVARGHSDDMMRKGYFSHTSSTPGRKTVSDRYKAVTGKTARFLAENIYTLQAQGPRRLSEANIRRCHEAWMKSPGHRANILRKTPPAPAYIGVGITVKGGSFWATQNFMTPH